MACGCFNIPHPYSKELLHSGFILLRCKTDNASTQLTSRTKTSNEKGVHLVYSKMLLNIKNATCNVVEDVSKSHTILESKIEVILSKLTQSLNC